MDVAPRSESEGAGVKKSWTNPICDACWDKTETREPVRAIGLGPERCCLCGTATFGGIYVRKDPELVRFPTYEAGE